MYLFFIFWDSSHTLPPEISPIGGNRFYGTILHTQEPTTYMGLVRGISMDQVVQCVCQHGTGETSEAQFNGLDYPSLPPHVIHTPWFFGLSWVPPPTAHGGSGNQRMTLRVQQSVLTERSILHVSTATPDRVYCWWRQTNAKMVTER